MGVHQMTGGAITVGMSVGFIHDAGTASLSGLPVIQRDTEGILREAIAARSLFTSGP